MTSLLSLSPYPKRKKKNQIYIGIKKIWDVQMSQLVSVPIWRVRVPPNDELSEWGEHDWQPTESIPDIRTEANEEQAEQLTDPQAGSPEPSFCAEVLPQARSLLLCPLRKVALLEATMCGWVGVGCEPGLRCAPPMCYFGPGYVVKLAW